MQSSNPQPGSNPYSFLEASAAQKKPGLSLGGQSKNARILIVVAAVVILGILGSIVMAVLSSGGDKTTNDLTSIAQQQQELMRVADIGVEKAVTTDAKNLAITTKLSIKSDQQQTLTYLASQKHKLSTKTLALGKNTKTDAALAQAAQNNRFDEAFTATIGNLLIRYKQSVTQTYNDATARPNAKKLTTTLYNNINTLAVLVKDAQESR